MTPLQQRIFSLRNKLPSDTELVAVSKFQPASVLLEAYEGGQRIFGESRVQELQQKHDLMPKDICWHFIGHLQVNKVKYIAPFVTLIHAVDSLKLLNEIDKQASKHQRTIDCLLQIKVAQEKTKYGLSPESLLQLLSEGEWRKLQHVKLRGLMCMATNTEDAAQIAQEFEQAHLLFQKIRTTYFAEQADFNLRSWGMSDDYPIALAYGSNLIRVGSKLFGNRS